VPFLFFPRFFSPKRPLRPNRGLSESWETPSGRARTDPAHENGPDSTVSISITRQINAQFIAKGVKFVLQVGDMTNKGGPSPLRPRRCGSGSLYGGNRVFPMRGNHDLLGGMSKGINNLRINFPQDSGGGPHTFDTYNHGSDFAAKKSLDGDLNGDGFIDNADVAIVTSLRNRPASARPEADFDNDGTITVADARKLVLIEHDKQYSNKNGQR